MNRLRVSVLSLALVAAAASAAETPSLAEAHAWLRGLPKLGGGVNKGLDPDRFQKLTPDDLKTLKEVLIGGHPVLPSGKLGGHLKLADADYRHLTALPALETLKFPENDLGDEALRHVGRVVTLKRLQLMENQITDDGLKHLAGLVNLTHLDLSWNKSLTAAGVQHLAGLPKLTHLELRACDMIDDAAVPHLMKIGTLQELHVFRTKITPEGVARIEKALPKCRVVVAKKP